MKKRPKRYWIRWQAGPQEITERRISASGAILRAYRVAMRTGRPVWVGSGNRSIEVRAVKR